MNSTKKLLFFILALITLNVSVNAQQNEVGDFAEQGFTYDVSGGNTTLTTKNLLGFTGLSFQLVSTSFDQATATIQIQKSNNGVEYLDVAGATLTFSAGTNTNFIKISNVKNTFYRAVITVNTVTSGSLVITLTGTK